MDDLVVEITDLKRRQTVSEHRIADLESELKDIRQLTTAVVQVNDKVDRLKSDMDEVKSDVKKITARPGKWWDKVISAALGAFAAGLTAAILAAIMR